MKPPTVVRSSFRDPSGFLFIRNSVLYRQINKSYQNHYHQLMTGGLYEQLVSQRMLIPHTEAESVPFIGEDGYRVIQPEVIPFISYPYEWCFSQLKDAALLLLQIQETAMAFGMSLKDGSAFNIQFRENRPVFIDTLSFEPYREGHPWIAYRQFCQHFLAPLSLISARDHRLGKLSAIHLDGIPLDLCSRLLPARSWFKFSLASHIHLHARTQQARNKSAAKSAGSISRYSLRALVDSLKSAITKLRWKPEKTAWSGYYQDTNYSPAAQQSKETIVSGFLKTCKPTCVWDIGANIGTYSRTAAGLKAFTVAFDLDAPAVEQNYRQCRQNGDTRILPLWMDITNPSPGIGWDNRERDSLLSRGPVDAILALALVHHLAIANNLPLSRIADLFSKTCKNLIVEFIPKSDSQVKRMLASREDIFSNYTREAFETEFARFFKIIKKDPIRESDRVLYLMTCRVPPAVHSG